MYLFRIIFTAALLLGAVPMAHAEAWHDDHELPAPDFGWVTLAVLMLAGAGAAGAQRIRQGR
jgi:hypothetical protein